MSSRRTGRLPNLLLGSADIAIASAGTAHPKLDASRAEKTGIGTEMENLKKVIEENGVEVSDKMIGQFASYLEEILEWNEKVNLTAITDRKEFIQKHFIDSVLIAGREEIKNANVVIDVGTGAGFPGVPLAIIFPSKKFVLMDSLNKRLKIIDDICGKLAISNISTFHGRAEELGQKSEFRECFDLCISRAVANLATLSEYCLPFVKVGGYFCAYKGPEAENEIKAAGKALGLLGGELKEIFTPQGSHINFDHNILIYKKVKQTPKKYPRKPGTPAKEPLK